MFRKVFIACSILFFFCTIPAFATIGVGINNGKIIITEKLKPGAIYKLPNIIVFNTGTEVSDYELSIKYNEKQPEIKPDGSWFHFSPDHFTLPPHGTKSVTATLQLPLNAQPGNYFSYIDAHPIVGTMRGITTIGIAAGSKVYFTVIPANTLSAIYYRLFSLFTEYAPWSYIIVSSIVIIALGYFFGRKFKINIGIQKKD